MFRKKIIEFLESNETYNKVLDIISNECRLNGTQIDDYPQEYFLAGGSVANTVHFLLNKSDKPIINDVDLFYFNHLLEPNWGFPVDSDFFLNQRINPLTSVDGYGTVWLGSEGEEIRMVNSERFNIINKVTINVHLFNREFKVTDYYKELLNNFDLSCTPVGLDRINGKIIYTDRFVDFLATNQIEVIGILHPLQTAVRMYKKIKELKTDSSNFNNEMSLLQHSLAFFHSGNRRGIGPEWVEKSKKYKEFVSFYFERDNNNNYLEPNNNLFYYTAKKFEVKPYISQFSFDGQNSLIGFWDLFVRLKHPKNLNKLVTFYIQNRNLMVEDKILFWDPNIKRIKNNIINNRYFDFINCFNLSINYLNYDYEISELIKVDKFFKILNDNGLNPQPFIVKNIKEQIKFIDFFQKRFIDNHGFIKNGILQKVLKFSFFDFKERLKISSLDKETKINSFNKLLNNLWIKPKNKFYFKHKFNKSLFSDFDF